jgi:Sigma-54 interaction domain
MTSPVNVLALLRFASKAAEVSAVTIFLEGETGTGKQVLAQGIHLLDEKCNPFPFVTFHCSTISFSGSARMDNLLKDHSCPLKKSCNKSAFLSLFIREVRRTYVQFFSPNHSRGSGTKWGKLIRKVL